MGNTEKTELTVMCMICDGTKILVQDRVNKDWPGVSFSKVVMISNITAVDRCRYLYPQIPIRLTLTAHQQPFTSSEHLHFGKNML